MPNEATDERAAETEYHSLHCPKCGLAIPTHFCRQDRGGTLNDYWVKLPWWLIKRCPQCQERIGRCQTWLDKALIAICIIAVAALILAAGGAIALQNQWSLESWAMFAHLCIAVVVISSFIIAGRGRTLNTS